MERRAFGRMLGGWLAGLAALPLLKRKAVGAPDENPRPDDYPPVQEFPVYEADDPRCGQASTVFDTVRPGAVFHMVIGDADENPARAAEIMRHWREQEVPEYFVVTGWHTVPAGMFGNAEAYQSPDLENLRHRPTYAEVKRILAEADRPAPHEDTSAHILPRDKFTFPPVIEWPLYDIRDPRFESSDISGGLPLGAVVRFTIVRYDYSTPASLKWARKAWCGYWVLTSKYTPAKPPLISNLTSFIRHTPVGRRPTHADVARILAKEART